VQLIDILKEHVRPSMGCTEPAAVARTAAVARRAIGGEIQRVRVTVDPRIFRNGLSVGLPVPGQHRGNLMAAALGAIAGDPDLDLKVLSPVTAHHLAEAQALIAADRATLHVDRRHSELYVEANVVTSEGTGRAITAGTHTNVVLVEVNGTPVQHASRPHKHDTTRPKPQPNAWLATASVADMTRRVQAMNEDAIRFTLQGIRMNERAAQEGLRLEPALAVGARLQHRAQATEAADCTLWQGPILTAAAIDARMAGLPIQIMSSSGSGNQGITVTMPPSAVARCLDLSEERLARSVALGHLLLASIAREIGLLSVLCGAAVQAAAAASGAIVWLLDGGAAQVEQAASAVLGTHAGVLCDGAKGSCALKATCGASTAVRTAFLSLEGLQVPRGNGLIGTTLLETARNVALIAHRGMKDTDHYVLGILEKAASRVQ